MGAALLLGAHEIGKINLVSPFFHKVEHFFHYGAMALLLARSLGSSWI